MGRVKNTPEERNAITAAFIDAATEMVAEDGIDSISIRKVSAKAGYSSATMYLYFDGLDELATLASIGYLREYVSELSKKLEKTSGAEQVYLQIWETFGKYSFSNAPVFDHLFFGRHTKPLDEIVKGYYSIFPHELDKVNGATLSMLMAGDLRTRNMRTLKPYAAELGLSDEKTTLVNDLVISYFHTLLGDACEQKMTAKKVKEYTARMIEANSFLLGR